MLGKFILVSCLMIWAMARPCTIIRCQIQRWNRHCRIHFYSMCSLFFQWILFLLFHSTTKNINDCLYEKDYLVCNLPNKSKLHIVQLHVIQKYMDIALVLGTMHSNWKFKVHYSDQWSYEWSTVHCISLKFSCQSGHRKEVWSTWKFSTLMWH